MGTMVRPGSTDKPLSRRGLLAAAAAAVAGLAGCSARAPEPTATPAAPGTVAVPSSTAASTATVVVVTDRTPSSVPPTPSPTAAVTVTPKSAPPLPTMPPRDTSTPTPVIPASEQIALGAYLPGAQWDANAINEFAALTGAAPAIVMWYQDWAHTEFQGFDPAKLDAVVTRGATPMITWEPDDYSGSANQPSFALRRILAGAYDDWIRAFAQASAAWGKPYFLRFAHEMNGNWYSWSPGVNGNTSAQYVAVWRRVVQIFRAEGATRVRWVWSPSGVYPGSTPFADLYPGDAYVDWIGINVFNFGTSASWSEWGSFADILGPSYLPLTRLTDRPLMIAEAASTEHGGDKAAWIRKGFLADLPETFPRVRAAVWFNENREADWQVNSSPAALAAYSEVARAPRFRGRVA